MAIKSPLIRQRLARSGSYLVLTILAIIVGFPLYVIFADSLMSLKEIASSPPAIFPLHPLWSTYRDAWVGGNLGHYLVVSVLQTALIVAGQVLTSVVAAFAFAFCEFPFKRTIFVTMLATSMIPFEVTVTANLQTMASFHLASTLPALVLPFLATGFGIFLLRQAFLQIPKEMHEAAVIDGYSAWSFLWKIAVPLARPAIAALCVFSFLGAWNQYLWPLVEMGSNTSIETIQLAIKGVGGTISMANISLAAAAIAVAPLLILLVFFQKHLIRSLTAGAVK
jgi:sn-glycerol 3-phosphate transport system permease protein